MSIPDVGIPSQPPGVLEDLLADDLKPKYIHPRILLLDLAPDLVDVLRDKGYNASSGTFGLPYRIEAKNSYEQLRVSHDLPQYAEQEMIFVDLSHMRISNYPTGHNLHPDWEDDWWQKPSRGLIDPRPYSMTMYRDDTERMLWHGGVLVVFAQAPYCPDQVIGHTETNYHGRKTLTVTGEVQASNWSVLPSDLASDLYIQFDSGEEISVCREANELADVLDRHLDGARFSCTVEPADASVSGRWLTIATNKYGKPVAGVIEYGEKNKRTGWVFLAPQLKDKSGFIQDFLFNFLPGFVPHLFPGHEGENWIHRPEYELPKVLAVQNEISQLRATTERKIIELDSKIDELRKADRWMHDIITSQGSTLRLAVLQALNCVGFKNIVDVDQELELRGSSGVKMEDLQIRDGKPVLLVETKGIGGMPADSDVTQVAKNVLIRAREWKVPANEVSGLTIINHQMHLPPDERKNDEIIRAAILKNLRQQYLGLMTTWDLYRLIRSARELGWTHDQVRGVFYRSGRIEPIPVHYKYMGTIEHCYEKAGAIRISIEESTVSVGDLIAFELPVEFIEEQVTSIRLDDVQVEKATAGSTVGILSSLTRSQARPRVRVFRVASTPT